LRPVDKACEKQQKNHVWLFYCKQRYGRQELTASGCEAGGVNSG
jgi:hypothetical protein